MLTVSMALAGVLVMAAPANAAINRPVAIWQMNEPAGSRTMVDSSGNGLNGIIGASVQEGTALAGGGTGYRFPYIRPNTPPADPEHLAVVPHSNAAQPGHRRLRGRVPDAHHPLLRQRHPEGPGRGGGRLLEVPAAQRQDLLPVPGLGREQHRLRRVDGQGQRRQLAHGPLRAHRLDGHHDIDGVVTGRNRNATGTIANTRPVTIAGKGNCDQVEITCDYFSGDIDYVRIETS